MNRIKTATATFALITGLGISAYAAAKGDLRTAGEVVFGLGAAGTAEHFRRKAQRAGAERDRLCTDGMTLALQGAKREHTMDRRDEVIGEALQDKVELVGQVGKLTREVIDQKQLFRFTQEGKTALVRENAALKKTTAALTAQVQGLKKANEALARSSLGSQTVAATAARRLKAEVDLTAEIASETTADFGMKRKPFGELKVKVLS